MSAESQTPLIMVANRGEIALRLVRGIHDLGMRALVVYDDVDSDLPFVVSADEAVEISGDGKSPYLDAKRLVDVARAAGASAVHPGYGFLSEKASFAEAVIQAGISWIGPSPSAIEAMGDKVRSKQLMVASGVPVVPGTAAAVNNVETALGDARDIGYPVMLKSSAGGGGMGMVIARDEEDLAAQFEPAQIRAQHLFNDPTLLLERYIEHARHIEIQIFGLADGTIVALGERDCSVQRRHQKVVEESPSPMVDAGLRHSLNETAIKAGEAIGYLGAGTVEFVVDAVTGEYFFLEMNTRLQVEHPVTECVMGVDLVAEQIRLALGMDNTLGDIAPEPKGHAIELRIYAEDPVRFFPSPGPINQWIEPSGEGVRVDAGYMTGNTVSRRYDPLLAKLIAYGTDRSEALAVARRAVAGFTIDGPRTNLPFLLRLLDEDAFVSGQYDTGLIASMKLATAPAVAAQGALS